MNGAWGKAFQATRLHGDRQGVAGLAESELNLTWQGALDNT
jgi:hypothetical protein